MRNLKKFLALVLAMMMAFSLLVTVNAANDKDNGSYNYSDRDTIAEEFVEAVDVLYGMGVMTGDYSNFKGDQGILRMEMAAVLYRLMTGDTGALKDTLYAEQATSRFIDVNENAWYAPYVGWCYDAGIMVGNNGYFRPDAKVTGYETLVMVLRAMGYGKNGEFTGMGWSVNASATGTTVGLLDDVKKVNYVYNNLSLPARRDVVASIVFQAAQLPTVRYEYGYYNKYVGVAIATQGNVLNESLGEMHFGLACAHGIVVGNQATGETATKIGFTRMPQPDIVNSKDQDLVGDLAYVYESRQRYDADQELASPTGTADIKNRSNATLRFDWETDLSLFNHAVRVWYNYNTTSGKTQTYALYDEVVATAIVAVDGASNALTTLTTGYLTGLLDGDADAANNWDDTEWRDAGAAYFNYSFAAMNEENKAASANGQYSKLMADVTAYGIANADPITAISPVLENNGTTKHGLYLLISNTPGNYLDVVISLDLTMTKVTQTNVTTRPYSVGVLNGNGLSGTPATSGAFSTNGYFGVATDIARLTSTTGGTYGDYVSLLKNSLLNTKDEAQALGAKVAAIEITGTTGTAGSGVPSDGTNAKYGANGRFDNTNTGFDSTFYYQLTVPQYKITDTVIKVDTANNDVYLKNNGVVHQSVFAEATDETFIKNDLATNNNLSGMEGYDVSGSTVAPTFRLKAGQDYTFTLDNEPGKGNYVYWETASKPATFVYGTFIDFETVPASSHFDYPLVYVNTQGDQRQKVNVTNIDNRDMDTWKYDDVDLNKRDDPTQGNNSGYVPGLYIGYKLDGTTLTSVTTKDDTGFVQDSSYQNSLGATVPNFATTAQTIVPADVAVGAHEVGTTGSGVFLTENTQFYIVDGAGMVNQTVTPYKGISALMEGCDSVEIHGEYDSATPASGFSDYLDEGLLTGGKTSNIMFYYETKPFEYHQNYNDSAVEIKTIFLPKDCVKFNKSTEQNMVFVGDASVSLINSNNGNWASQFTVWNKGDSKNVWITGNYSVSGTDANTVLNNGDNVFYKLEDSGKTASDGEPIYDIKGLDPRTASRTVIGYYYCDGTSTTPVAHTHAPVEVAQTGTLAATFTANQDAHYYRATTFNQQAAYIQDGLTSATPNNKLYNVGSAGIKNLNTLAYPGLKDNDLQALNGAGSLIDNESVPVSCILDPNDTQLLTISFIYVNADKNPTPIP